MTISVETDLWLDEDTLREYLAVEGWDFFAAADYFDTSEVHVKLHVKEYGIEPRWKDEDVMRSLSEDSISCSEAARELGLSRKGAAYWFDQHGLERPTADAEAVPFEDVWDTIPVERVASAPAQRRSQQSDEGARTPFDGHWDRLRAEALELYHR